VKQKLMRRQHPFTTKLLLFLAVMLAWPSIGGGLVPSSHVSATPNKLIVYDDQLKPTFTNYSWANHSLSDNAIVHEGAASILMKPNNDDGLYLYSDRILRTEDYPLLELWVNGGQESGRHVEVVLQAGGQPAASQLLDPSLFSQGEWQKVAINLAELNLPNGIFDGILIRGTTSGPQPELYLDDIVLSSGGMATEKNLVAISLSRSALTLRPGDLAELRVTAKYSDGTTAPLSQGITWSSSAEEIAAVTAAGIVDGAQAGTAVITAVYDQLSTAIPVTVNDNQEVPGEDGIAGITVYDDALNPAFKDYSWAQRDLADNSVVHSGSAAISFDPGNEGGFYLYKDNGAVNLKEYDRLEFWINGGMAGSQEIELVFNAGGQPVARVNLDSLLEDGKIPQNVWTKVTVELKELQIKDQIFDGLLFRGLKNGPQMPVYLDDIRLLEKYVAPPVLVEGVLSQYGMVLAPGDSAKVVFEARYSNSTSADISNRATWTSNNPDAVTVENGVLTAVGSGLASITASHGEATASLYVQVSSHQPEAVYEDGLAAGYSNWSWGTQSFENAAPVASGSQSIAFIAKGYEGIWMHRDTQMDLKHYYGLTLQVHGGVTGGQQLRVSLMDGRSFVGDFDLSDLLPDGAPADQWTEVKLKFADLGVSDLTFDGIVVSAWGEEDQGTVYFDNISMLKTTSVINLPEPELPAVQVVIDSAKERATLSPGIFGLNFEDMPSEGRSMINVPIKRWGGNQMTRYNWQIDTTNRGGDWYFLNVPYDNEDPSQLPAGSLSDRFIQDSINTNTDVLLQIPTIGWTPKTREIGWSFSIDKYGAQQSNECDWKEAWCRADAGNGKNKDGSYLGSNHPEDASKQVGPEFVADWIKHLQSRFGDTVHNYALDNEPMLWGHSHWDVHPEMTTYDEVWEYTQSYGKAIKEADPQANIFGPVPWGWCEYFYSAKDGCSPGADMEAHDGKPYLEWLLEQNEEYRKQNGNRLIDTLDIHYYPAENNIAFSSDETPAMVKRRLNSLKSLYDPNFVDSSSWIQEPVKLIPRMHELINDNAPGMKLSISEYNFGDGNGIGSGLAQAEALALFAREGVDYAMRWGALNADTPLEDAFKLYLDYDGNGSRITGDVVSTSSSNIDAVGSYTIVSPEGKTYILLFNKDSAPRQANLQADINLNQSAEVYRFEARKRLYKAGVAAGTDEGLALTLPARSATLLVLS
jgi:hypothetical protein